MLGCPAECSDSTATDAGFARLRRSLARILPLMRISPRPLLLTLAAGLAACGGMESGDPPVMVFAAASLRNVAADLAVEMERRHGVGVVYNFAGSNTLAQQIRAAPGADVFLSADEQWVDVLEDAGRTVTGTRRAFLSNRLVVIARRDAALEIDDPRELADAASGVRFLALADPQAVPAGRYARAALERLDHDGGDLWSALADKVAPALDVRAALALVESDPEIAGVVYRSDAMTSQKVRVLCELPAADDAPIRYSAVLIAGGAAPELGRLFLDFLLGPAAREIAERHGFSATVSPQRGRPGNA